MTKIKKTNNQKPVLIGLALSIVVIVGLITGAIGINRIENYNNPYIFGFIFGGIGLLLGIYITNRLKKVIAVNREIEKSFWIHKMFISIGLVGIFILIGSLINQSISTLDKCDSFELTDKYRKEYRSRSPEINSLIFTIKGKSQRLICSRNFWYKTALGQKVELCFYRSLIGFDYIIIADDKK